MTNAKKYLKDGTDIQELAEELEQAIYRRMSDNLSKVIIDFFNKKIAMLTEDEKVILRNLQNVRYIGRTEGTGYLYATFNTIDNYSNRSDITDIDLYFSKMFPFIKERRRI